MTLACAFACLVALQIQPGPSPALANASRDLSTLEELEFGRHPVGVRLIRAWDTSRRWPSPGDAAGTRGRPVQITLFYPSVEIGAMPVTVEEHILADWAGEFRKSYPAEERDAALGAAKRTFEEGLDRALTDAEWSRVRSALSRGRVATGPLPGAHPLILLQAGMTSRGFTLLTLAEALASHGYVVGALATFGRTHVERLGFDAAGVRALADDAGFALGLLSTRPEVDASRIGLVAWSVGGVSHAWLRLERPEAFRAAVSLDSGTGYSYGAGLLRQHPAFNLRSPRGPFLQFDLEEANARIARDDSFFRAHPKDEAERFVLTGLLHGDLVLPYGVGRSVALGTPAKSLRALGRVLLTFLELHLRGRATSRDPGGTRSWFGPAAYRGKGGPP
jgi:hypothetical protein